MSYPRHAWLHDSIQGQERSQLEPPPEVLVGLIELGISFQFDAYSNWTESFDDKEKVSLWVRGPEADMGEALANHSIIGFGRKAYGPAVSRSEGQCEFQQSEIEGAI